MSRAGPRSGWNKNWAGHRLEDLYAEAMPAMVAAAVRAYFTENPEMDGWSKVHDDE